MNARTRLSLALAVPLLVMMPAGGPAVGGERGGEPSCYGEPATITGTPHRDQVTGTDGADVIVTGKGFDVVRGGGAADLICTGRGGDDLYGGAELIGSTVAGMASPPTLTPSRPTPWSADPAATA